LELGGLLITRANQVIGILRDLALGPGLFLQEAPALP